MEIKDFLSIFCEMAPEENQSTWDNSGVQIAGTKQDVRSLAVCLEPTPLMVQRALDWGADVILTHHPLSMKPQSLNEDGMYLDVVRRVIPAGAWLYAAHTSLDTRSGGPAFWLGHELCLGETQILEVERRVSSLEVSVCDAPSFAPSLFEQWQTMEGVYSVSQEEGGEVRLICTASAWPVMRQEFEKESVRPLQFYVRSLLAPQIDIGFGEVGILPEPLPWPVFAEKILSLTGCDALSVSGPEPEMVRSVAYCGGSGASLVERAAKLGADVFVTGDVKYHGAVAAPICMIDVGHFSFEEEMMRRLAVELDLRLNDVEVRFLDGVNPFRLHLKSSG